MCNKRDCYNNEDECVLGDNCFFFFMAIPPILGFFLCGHVGGEKKKIKIENEIFADEIVVILG